LQNKPYHKEHLREQLIEEGIRLLAEAGPKEFSLRKAAARCDVSHTAPYSYFKDKEALITAMGEYVTDEFMRRLDAAVAGQTEDSVKIPLLGHTYITFFMENPHYYQFLFYYANVMIDLDNENERNFQPFKLFRETVYGMFDHLGVPRDQYTKNLIALWSMAHGVVSLMTNPNIVYSGDWREVFTDSIFSGKG